MTEEMGMVEGESSRVVMGRVPLKLADSVGAAERRRGASSAPCFSGLRMGVTARGGFGSAAEVEEGDKARLRSNRRRRELGFLPKTSCHCPTCHCQSTGNREWQWHF